MFMYRLDWIMMYIMVITLVVTIFSCATSTKICTPYSKVEDANCATYRSGKTTNVDCRVLLENGERKDIRSEVFLKGDAVNKCTTEYVLPFDNSISYEREE